MPVEATDLVAAVGSYGTLGHPDNIIIYYIGVKVPGSKETLFRKVQAPLLFSIFQFSLSVLDD